MNKHLARVYFLQTTKYTEGIERDDFPATPPPEVVDCCVF